MNLIVVCCGRLPLLLLELELIIIQFPQFIHIYLDLNYIRLGHFNIQAKQIQ